MERSAGNPSSIFLPPYRSAQHAFLLSMDDEWVEEILGRIQGGLKKLVGGGWLSPQHWYYMNMNLRQFYMGRAIGFFLIILVLAVVALIYKLSEAPLQEQRLTAEQVVDLEVQAEQDYLKTQQGQ